MAYSEATNHELAFFDGIRGLVALCVLLVHALVFTGSATVSVLRGSAILDVFMFMSGFFMAYHYRARQTVEPWQSTSTWVSFYLRRFFRIAPLYYLLLTIALIFQEPLFRWLDQIFITFPPPWSHMQLHDPTVRDRTLLSILSHYTFLFGFIPRFAANTPLPDWTIGLEMQFYLAFPFLMLLYVRLGYIWITLLLLIALYITNLLFAVYIASPPGLFGNFPQPTLLFFKIDCFMIGILLAEAFYFKDSVPATSVFILLIVVSLSLFGKSGYFFGPVLLCVVLLFYDRTCDTLKIAKLVEMADRILSSRVCKFLGDSSYSVYLLHLLVIIPVGVILDTYSIYLELRPAYRFLLLTGLVIPITYTLSYIAFNHIEKPSIKLGKSMVRVLATRRTRITQQTKQPLVETG